MNEPFLARQTKHEHNAYAHAAHFERPRFESYSDTTL